MNGNYILFIPIRVRILFSWFKKVGGKECLVPSACSRDWKKIDFVLFFAFCFMEKDRYAIEK